MDSVISRENKDKQDKTLEINKVIENFRKKDVIEKDVLTLLDFYDNPKPKDQSNDLLNLSKMLNIIDGIPERTGQIMICCTNHPEKLDPALLRPGRVDCLIHFDKMTSENVLKMVTNYSGEININKKYHKIIDKIENCNKFWTPAEIFQICSKYEKTKDILEFIIKCQKKDLQ